MYVNDADKITNESVSQILRSAESYKYKNYKFNKAILKANIDVNAGQTDTETDSDKMERIIKIEKTKKGNK